MTFNSYIFILCFLPITVTGYHVINSSGRYTLGLVHLLIASLIFYGYFNPAYLLVIGSSIFINYGIYKFLDHSSKMNWSDAVKKTVMVVGILLNISLLGYFKYTDFFIDNINHIFKTDYPLVNILLPLGISFFTFQQISFVIDEYMAVKIGGVLSTRL